MRLRTAIVCLSLAVPALGLAQAMPGLDLSQPPRPKDEEQPPAQPTPPPAQPAAKPGEAKAPLGPSGERDVALGDRVKAVQRKGFLKKGRFDVTPLVLASMNDAYYLKFGAGLRLAYNFGDTFALAARGVYYWPLTTENVRIAQIALDSQIVTSTLYGQAMLDGVWSPIYGKAAVLGRDIVHFDVYLLAGVGAVWSSTSLAPQNQGPHLATDLGAGVRFYPKEWMAFELGVIATVYSDRAAESVPSTVQTVFGATVGVSFFLPTSFEYVYP
jgi:outer membrane beta-barrel protein